MMLINEHRVVFEHIWENSDQVDPKTGRPVRTMYGTICKIFNMNKELVAAAEVHRHSGDPNNAVKARKYAFAKAVGDTFERPVRKEFWDAYHNSSIRKPR